MRSSARSAGGADSPSIASAGSPGTRWISAKTSVATPSSTGTVSARRRSVYANMPGAMIAQSRQLRQLQRRVHPPPGRGAAAPSRVPDESGQGHVPLHTVAPRALPVPPRRAGARRRGALSRGGRSSRDRGWDSSLRTCAAWRRVTRPCTGAATASPAITFCSSRILPGQVCRPSPGKRVGAQHGALPGFRHRLAPENVREQRQVLESIPKRGKAKPHHGQPEPQVIPESARRHRLAQWQVGGRHHAHVDRRGAFSPRRRISCSWSTRSSLACARGDSSLTSSRNSVPA